MSSSVTRTITIPIALMVIFGFVLVGCGGEEHEADVLDSGTYQGSLMEVKPEEKEIYVETDNGQTIELYFTEETELVNSEGNSIPFSELSTDDRVEVEVEKVGQRNDPIRVQLLEG